MTIGRDIGASSAPAVRVAGERTWLLLLANLIVHTLEQGCFAALSMHAVTTLGMRTSGNGMLQALQAIPLVLLALPMGALADRRSRRAMVLCAEGLRACVYVALAVLAAHGAGVVAWQVVGVAALCLALASASTGYTIGLLAVVPELESGRSNLTRLNARLELTKTVGYAAGPATFGWLLRHHGLNSVAYLASIGVAVSATLLGWIFFGADARKIKAREVSTDPRATAARKPGMIGRLSADVQDGVRYAWSTPVLRDTFAAQMCFSVAFGLILTALVPFASRRLAMDPQGIGALTAVMGAGMFVGSISSSAAMRRASIGEVLRFGAVTGAAGGALVFAAYAFSSREAAVAGMFLIGLGPMAWTVAGTTLRQLVTPPALLGRVAAVNVLTLGARVVGAVAGIAIGGLAGAAGCLAAASVFTALFAMVAVGSKAIGAAR